MRCQTAERHLTARSRAGNRLMTEKVLLSDIKRTQNRCFPLRLCVLCGKKIQAASTGSKCLCAKKFVFRAQNAHKTNGMAWRILSVSCRFRGGFCRAMCRILSDYVADFVGFVADFVGLVADFVGLVADFVGLCGGFCRTCGGFCRTCGGFCRANAPSISTIPKTHLIWRSRADGLQ